MRKAVDIMHKELLELTLTLSDVSTISDKSAVCAQLIFTTLALIQIQVYLGTNDSKNR
jgi:hypothetical protein